jgi:hypothetical protein
MAQCEQGYLCSVCGGDVENIWDSDLYLRYVIGQVDPETLHTTRERHIRCNPTLAQFIVDPDFAAVVVEGVFDKRQLDANYVREQERLITRGWRRIKELAHQEGVSLLDYPLPEVRARMKEGQQPSQQSPPRISPNAPAENRPAVPPHAGGPRD